LAIKSDIFVENFKVGDLKRYGLDYKSIQKLNPKIIYCSITGYGQDGSSSNKPGYDYVFQAIGGLMSVTGEDESLLGSEP
jgi:crotonobetainyl-CoA:carnitine CoA-transferase CaiB-like acyl-CoA transferase